MSGGLIAIEETRLGQNQRSATGRVNLRAPIVHAFDPREQAAVERMQILR